MPVGSGWLTDHLSIEKKTKHLLTMKILGWNINELEPRGEAIKR